MLTLFIVLIVAACILLMLVILVQNPKGGGLSSAFGGQGASQMLGGVKRSGDFLDKATWGLAIAIFVMVLGVNMFNGVDNTEQSQQSEITDELQGVSPDVNINNNDMPAEALPSGDEMPEPEPVDD